MTPTNPSSRAKFQSIRRCKSPVEWEVRKAIGRKYLKILRRANAILEPSLSAGNDFDAIDAAITQAEEVLAPMGPLFKWEPHLVAKAKHLKHALKERVELSAVLEALKDCDAADKFDEFVAAIQRADAIADILQVLPLHRALSG